MTEEAKAERREVIAELAGDKSPTCTFWLTRNRHEGALSDKIDVWLSRPQRLALEDGDIHWYVLGDDAQRDHYARWSISRARTEVHNGVPDTDRECTRVPGLTRGLEPVVPTETL